jgi:AcrR family transcriptional regulator
VRSRKRGPKRELSIEGIVDAAIEIADAGGLGAVSMSSVAARLGFTTMSLYRYVSAKDDLILLMQEHGTGVRPAAEDIPPGWREALAAWHAHAIAIAIAIYAAHPWLLDIPINGIPMTPNNLAWMDAAFEFLADTPLTGQQRGSVPVRVTGDPRRNRGSHGWGRDGANGPPYRATVGRSLPEGQSRARGGPAETRRRSEASRGQQA